MASTSSAHPALAGSAPAPSRAAGATTPPRLVPGLALVAAVTVGAYGLSVAVPVLSPLIWGVFIAMALVAVRPLPAVLEPGARFAARRLLRIGVALMGLRLGVDQLAAVGLPALGVLAITVPATLAGTLWLGRRLGLPRDMSLLVATGTAICGASAVAAMDAATDARREDVTVAVATVTLFGTAALVLLPLLGAILGLGSAAFGTWVGASVHEVAQVVAAATPGGPAALETATVVKLTRVLMLAPLVLGVVLWRRRCDPATAAPGRTTRTGPVPPFIVGFLVCVAIAGSGSVPPQVLAGAVHLDTLLLTAALAGLGLGVSARALTALGWRPMALGAGAWTIATGVALVAVLALTP